MNNLSDPNISENTAEGNIFYKQYLNDISSGNIDFQPFVEDKNDDILSKSLKLSSNDKQSVAGKVKGVTIPQSPIESINIKESDNDSIISKDSSNEPNGDRSHTLINGIEYDTSSTDPTEDLVREWEAKNKELSSTFRKIANLAANIHITYQRGITVSDLVSDGFGKDYAEKLLPQSASIGLLHRLDNRLGKQYQYVLSNYVHILNSADVDVDDKEILPSDVSLILASELSGMKYVYHNIQLLTCLNYNADYHVLNWDAPSGENKQKVKSFNLESKRNVNFRVSPNGTVNISIECTYRPFEFHNVEGLMNFFGTCGKIESYLELSTKNRVNVVPWFGNWSLMQFDYNKDLPTKTLKDKYHSKVINWSSKGVLKVYYLGVIFRIYCKIKPYIGECLRTEGRFSTKDKVKITDSLPRITAVSSTAGYPSNNTDDLDNKSEIKHPFTTIEEMLLNRKSESETLSTKDKDKEERI